MKKTLFTFLTLVLVVSASTGICFAAEDDGYKAYLEDQATVAEISKPVISDQEYPEWGFKIHSVIAGTGSETIVHTQVIDMTTGTVTKEFDRKCNYPNNNFSTN